MQVIRLLTIIYPKLFRRHICFRCRRKFYFTQLIFYKKLGESGVKFHCPICSMKLYDIK